MLNNSAYAYIASDFYKLTLKSTDDGVLAIANRMSSDPISLYDRLLAVKPAGLSLNAWRSSAGLSQAVFTDIKRRDGAKHDTIEKLLKAIGVTFAEFEAGARGENREPPTPEAKAPYLAFRGDDRPRDIPIVGTALCADVHIDTDGEAVDVEAMEMDFDDVIDYARRPLTLDNRREIYALYFRGVSMAPRYEPGEIGYVDPKRPPVTGDYVVVQLRSDDQDGGERISTVIAKRLVRQTARFFVLEQFNPPLTFQVERGQVKHLHRIIPWDELVTF